MFRTGYVLCTLLAAICASASGDRAAASAASPSRLAAASSSAASSTSTASAAAAVQHTKSGSSDHINDIGKPIECRKSLSCHRGWGDDRVTVWRRCSGIQCVRERDVSATACLSRLTDFVPSLYISSIIEWGAVCGFCCSLFACIHIHDRNARLSTAIGCASKLVR